MQAALLFDLDGTLVDTDSEHLIAFQSVFARHGISLTREDYVAKIMGVSNPLIAQAFLSHFSPEAQMATIHAKEAMFRENLGALTPIAGAGALLDYAQLHGLKRAVVTNAPRDNAEKVLAAIGFGERLPLRIFGGELARAKPDPLPYLTGLERTRAHAKASVAFEDSLAGVQSALGAGLAVIGLTTTLSRATLLNAGASLAVEDYTDERIYGLIDRRRAAA